jgi:simple sugar transport system permease protein
MHYAADFYGIPPLLSILLALVVSALIGLGNGLIVCLLKVPSFVTTLGTFYLLFGVVLTTSHAYPAEIPPSMEGRIQSWLGAGNWAELFWCLLIVGYFHIVLDPHPLGHLHRSRSAGTCSGRPRPASGSTASRSATS